MEDVATIFLEQVQQQSIIEVLAVVFSLLYPWLAAKQSIWCWPSALASTSLYVYIFWEVSLPFQSMLNAYYLAMAVYGWVKWRRGADQVQETLKVSQLPLYYHLFAIPVLFLGGLALSHLVSFSWFESDLYLDALVTVFSVYATYLMVYKVLENWLFWLAINSAAAYLYFQHDLYLTSVVFIAYLFMAVFGYLQWKKELDSTVASQT